jgi:hypothetical protein
MRHEDDCCWWRSRDVEEVLVYLQEPYGHERGVNEENHGLISWCPVPQKFWPSYLLSVARRCCSGDVRIVDINARLVALFAVSLHFFSYFSKCCMSEWRVDGVKQHLQLAHAGLDWRKAQERTLVLLRSPNCVRISLEVLLLNALFFLFPSTEIDEGS